MCCRGDLSAEAKKVQASTSAHFTAATEPSHPFLGSARFAADVSQSSSPVGCRSQTLGRNLKWNRVLWGDTSVHRLHEPY